MFGNCLCGLIRFEIVGVVPKLYQCHCSLCRKQGGASSNTAAIISDVHFRWLGGQEQISSWQKETGFRSDFCANCGLPVPNPLRSTPYFWVPAGLLEAGVQLEVIAHLFVGSKAEWDEIPATKKQYETMPELSELLTLK